LDVCHRDVYVKQIQVWMTSTASHTSQHSLWHNHDIQHWMHMTIMGWLRW